MFTRQQLQGGGKYGRKSLIGNWNEDQQQEEVKFADYLDKKQGNGLVVSQRHQTVCHALQKSPWSFREDGTIWFGDAVMIANVACDGAVLSLLPHGEEKWEMSTCAAEENPMARNIFRIAPVPKDGRNHDPNFESRPLRYTESFCLISEHSLRKTEDGLVLPPFWLSCRPKSFNNIAKLSGQAPVHMRSQYSPDAIWCVESALPGSEGWKVNVEQGEVKVSDRIMIKTKMTNLILTSARKHTFRGKITGATEHEVFATTTKAPRERHFWSIQTATEPEQAIDNRGLTYFSPDMAFGYLADVFGTEGFAQFIGDLEKMERDHALTNSSVFLSIKDHVTDANWMYVQVAIDFLTKKNDSVKSQDLYAAVEPFLFVENDKK